MAAQAANTANPAPLTPEDDRFTYADATSLESPTTVKSNVPGHPTAQTINISDLILQRNTAVRTISTFLVPRLTI